MIHICEYYRCQECHFLICYSEKLHECSYQVKVGMKKEMRDNVTITFHKLESEQYEYFDHCFTHFSIRVISFFKK